MKKCHEGCKHYSEEEFTGSGLCHALGVFPQPDLGSEAYELNRRNETSFPVLIPMDFGCSLWEPEE